MADLMGDEITQDQFKEMFFETNFYLVVVTMIVSLLHTVFSTLAIKNGINEYNILRHLLLEKLRFTCRNFSQNVILELRHRDNSDTLSVW